MSAHPTFIIILLSLMKLSGNTCSFIILVYFVSRIKTSYCSSGSITLNSFSFHFTFLNSSYFFNMASLQGCLVVNFWLKQFIPCILNGFLLFLSSLLCPLGFNLLLLNLSRMVDYWLILLNQLSGHGLHAHHTVPSVWVSLLEQMIDLASSDLVIEQQPNNNCDLRSILPSPLGLHL